MKNNQGEKLDYVHKVREETRRYIKDLLAKNDNLRQLAARLETEKHELEDRLRGLKDEFSSEREQASILRERLSQIENDNHRFSEQYAEVERQNSDLANLYVASYRLHSTLQRDHVLSTIQEIVINLIGSEELGIFELDDEGCELSLVSHFGIEPSIYGTIPVGAGIIGQTARTGENYFSEHRNGHQQGPEEMHLTSCIALKVDGKVTGAIAIFRLLQQKQGLKAVDHELMDLLATHAATALYCSRALAL